MEPYPVSARVVAVLGLVVVGALAFILMDVVSGGKLASLAGGDCGCEQEPAGA
jgi:hypothetical protein